MLFDTHDEISCKGCIQVLAATMEAHDGSVDLPSAFAKLNLRVGHKTSLEQPASFVKTHTLVSTRSCAGDRDGTLGLRRRKKKGQGRKNLLSQVVEGVIFLAENPDLVRILGRHLG